MENDQKIPLWVAYTWMHEEKEWNKATPGEKARLSSIAGRKLLRYLTKEKLQIDLEKERNPLGQRAQGKPYFIHHPHIHFNISHSEELVACVVTKVPVGFDLQFHKEKDWKKTGKRIFSPEEWMIYEKSGYDPSCFFDFWTKKESYLKYTGEGIRQELNQIEYREVTFIPVEIADAYTGKICISDKKSIDRIEIIHYTERCSE